MPPGFRMLEPAGLHYGGFYSGGASALIHVVSLTGFGREVWQAALTDLPPKVVVRLNEARAGCEYQAPAAPYAGHERIGQGDREHEPAAGISADDLLPDLRYGRQLYRDPFDLLEALQRDRRDLGH